MQDQCFEFYSHFSAAHGSPHAGTNRLQQQGHGPIALLLGAFMTCKPSFNWHFSRLGIYLLLVPTKTLTGTQMCRSEPWLDHAHVQVLLLSCSHQCHLMMPIIIINENTQISSFLWPHTFELFRTTCAATGKYSSMFLKVFPWGAHEGVLTIIILIISLSFTAFSRRFPLKALKCSFKMTGLFFAVCSVVVCNMGLYYKKKNLIANISFAERGPRHPI